MSTRHTNLIVLHCSATPSGKRIDQRGKDAAQVINDWHKQRGFRRSPHESAGFNIQLASIGYHYVIDLDGAVLTGRRLREVGAHAAMFNAHSVGICLVGGQERSARYTPAQWAALADLVKKLCRELRIPPFAPRRVHKATSPGYSVVSGVCGHRDLSPDKNGNGLAEPFEWLKTCPGFDVEAWLSNGMRPLPVHVFALDA